MIGSLRVKLSTQSSVDRKLLLLTGPISGISILSSLLWLTVLLDAGELSRVCPGLPLVNGVEGSIFSESLLTFNRSICGGSKDVPVRKLQSILVISNIAPDKACFIS